MTMEPAADVRIECWENTWKCCATAFIFQERARHLRRRLQTLSFLGIAVPAAIGGIVMTFQSLEDGAIAIILSIAGALLVAQLVLSIMSLTSRWEDSFAYALKSAALNTKLRLRYERLAKDAPTDIAEQFSALQEDDTELQIEDEKQGLTSDERIRGMRYSLLQYHKACIACNETPRSMTPTQCGICGNFKTWRI